MERLIKFSCKHCATQYSIADEKVLKSKSLMLRCKTCEKLVKFSVRDAEPTSSHQTMGRKESRIAKTSNAEQLNNDNSAAAESVNQDQELGNIFPSSGSILARFNEMRLGVARIQAVTVLFTLFELPALALSAFVLLTTFILLCVGVLCILLGVLEVEGLNNPVFDLEGVVLGIVLIVSSFWVDMPILFQSTRSKRNSLTNIWNKSTQEEIDVVCEEVSRASAFRFKESVRALGRLIVVFTFFVAIGWYVLVRNPLGPMERTRLVNTCIESKPFETAEPFEHKNKCLCLVHGLSFHFNYSEQIEFFAAAKQHNQFGDDFYKQFPVETTISESLIMSARIYTKAFITSKWGSPSK